MVIMSLVFGWAFTYKEYAPLRPKGAPHTSVFRSIMHSFNYCASHVLVNLTVLISLTLESFLLQTTSSSKAAAASPSPGPSSCASPAHTPGRTPV